MGRWAIPGTPGSLGRAQQICAGLELFGFRGNAGHAEYADGWNVSSTGAERYRRMAEEFERACAEVGRDPATVRRSWIGGCACARTQEEAEAIAAGRFSNDDDEDFSFVGTPQQLVEQMRPFVALGVDPSSWTAWIFRV